MLQLNNTTPFKASIAVLPDKNGIDTLHVVVKATLSLKPRLALATTQVPVTLADEYFGEPEHSSLKHPSEMPSGKPGTDILFRGSAHGPEGREVTQSLVALTAAERETQLRVSGDRLFTRDGGITAPQPFAKMPLDW